MFSAGTVPEAQGGGGAPSNLRELTLTPLPKVAPPPPTPVGAVGAGGGAIAPVGAWRGLGGLAAESLES